ncbi:tumor necrosis factor receptor superfamily member 22 isoform 2 [Mus musculus]|uniref:Tumor necrosis factor receptor superfamily member 22 n=1 Tax=Mus musculus TaxID=10090 RepID=TNR22_MOUSE|nr:tumor necrosis factor receptor superfamily member 22 isoform 2 [Mus musculus]Q9ER62.3 RecName: Full=Tumor necrosis factor receptor superfamily member 22; AltName: Full=Decoy TRAIL receptor 2; AltName: Full=TNF receptor family member SOBa; AltName: Full=TNF receptor homolog 2; AltName: Full=Tumor necrosis factor receptor p60 homolog 2 [Mus musculus]AAN87807.1 decoy TRAIL receptor 2 long form [Mus musculus]EDL18224.1 mCG128998, isoform CRA_a [Mus musculus]|eukprot:NP_001298074.1 tumor necrosis factor receptor superfamily member 22 isoform 2 [Mus musculus]
MFGFFCSLVSSLSRWFLWRRLLLLLLLLLLNLPLQVKFAMLELHSFKCPAGEYWSKDVCCKNCSAGTFVKAPCEIPHTQGQCEKCHPGTFTEKDNYLDACILCSTCDKDQEMVADCSATSDRKCQCRTGLYYYDPKFPESCRPCTKCPQGIPVLQECNSTANTVCSSSVSNPRNRLFLLLSPLSVLIVSVVVFRIIRR